MSIHEVDLLSNGAKIDYHSILMQQLLASKATIDSTSIQGTRGRTQTSKKIKQLMNYKEDKIFTLFAAQPVELFKIQWNFLSQKLPDVMDSVTSILQHRINRVVQDLNDEKLTIEEQKPLLPYSYQEEQKSGKLYVLKDQSEQIRRKMSEISNSLQSIEEDQMEATSKSPETKNIFAHLYTAEKKKEVEEFIRKKKEEKEERKKKLELQRLKDEEQLKEKEKEMREQEEKLKKQRIQQFMKKNLLQKVEESENKLKQLNGKPRLFELLERNYSKKKEYEEMERKYQMKNEKKSIYTKIDSLNLSLHEKNYDEIKRIKEEERSRRYSEYLEAQEKSQVRHHSSFQVTHPVDQSIEAKEKQEKIKHYESIVREKFKPKIDEQKRKEMENMIEELQLNSKRKLKKTKLENGDIIYEEMQDQDRHALGKAYLEMTKQMAAKARLNRSVSSSANVQSQPPKRKQLDYLEQMRNNPKPKILRRLSFVEQPNISFDEKMNKMMKESERLNDMMRKNEEKLKYGKFSTSEQILNCKQEIDNSYITIAKMKLKLIKHH